MTLSPVAGESVGGVEVCVELSSRPRATIVTATLSTQSLTANGKSISPYQLVEHVHYIRVVYSHSIPANFGVK